MIAIVVIIFIIIIVLTVIIMRRATVRSSVVIPSWIPSHVRPTAEDARDMIPAIFRGRRVASKSSMAVCCIVRDEFTAIKKNVPEILDFLKTHFRDGRMYILENDSTDGTKDVLREYSNRYDALRCDMRDGVSGTHAKKLSESGRSGLMSHLRQECLDWVLADDFHSDFIMVIDIDYDHLWLPGIFDSLGDVDAWDVVCANSVAASSFPHPMYDWGSFGCDRGKAFEKQGLPFKMRSGLERFTRYSYCFGSMSLYKTACIRRSPLAKYGGLEDNVIEHSRFVRDLQGRVVANPNMVIQLTWH